MWVFMRARRLVAAGAGAAASLAVLGLPAAHADSQPPGITVIPQDAALAPGSPGKTVQTQIEGDAIVEPQPGFAGADGAFTVGIDDEPPSTFAGMSMGDVDSNATNDTATFAIPAFGS